MIPDDLATPERLTGYDLVVRCDDQIQEDELRKLSRFTAPREVRVSASQPSNTGNQLTVHFVNYNRAEPPKTAAGKPNPGGGIKDEQPIAVRGVRANLRLPPKRRVVRVEVVSPEQSEPVRVTFQQTERRVQFELPEFLVYSAARVWLAEK